MKEKSSDLNNQNKSTEPTPYQLKVQEKIGALEYTFFKEGTPYTRIGMIEEQARALQRLRKKNPIEHDAVISSQEHYKNLFKLFPNWTTPPSVHRRFVPEAKLRLANDNDNDTVGTRLTIKT